jgi:hypothetical protein
MSSPLFRQARTPLDIVSVLLSLPEELGILRLTEVALVICNT